MSTEAFLLRNKLLSKLRLLPYFYNKGFTFNTNKAFQIQAENIPFCGVYLIDETGSPEGDANVGEVDFRVSAHYGISVIVQNNDPAEAEVSLDQAAAAIETLFADPTVYNWKNVGKPNEVAVQAFTRMSRTHQFGSVGAYNSTPIGELRFDLTCDLGIISYPTIITDVLETVHLETRYPAGSNPAEVQQVTAEYDLETEP